MQGDPDVLKLLNEQLTSELTAINQYFLHSKMQANWGFTEIAEHTRKEWNTLAVDLGGLLCQPAHQGLRHGEPDGCLDHLVSSPTLHRNIIRVH